MWTPLAMPACKGNDFATDRTQCLSRFSRHRYHGAMKAYSVVFECPRGGHNINLQRRLSQPSLSVTEAMTIFGKLELSCPEPGCGWHGKASSTKVMQIVPFIWILAPASTN